MITVQLWDQEQKTYGEEVIHHEEDGFGITNHGDLIVTKSIGPPGQPGQPTMGINRIAYAAGQWVKVEADQSKIDTTSKIIPVPPRKGAPH